MFFIYVKLMKIKIIYEEINRHNTLQCLRDRPFNIQDKGREKNQLHIETKKTKEKTVGWHNFVVVACFKSIIILKKLTKFADRK